ncbi:MAG TPA: hypothetical protein PLL20_02830 [Phycisphaerae bacterium]|nr:hypothetical protein [Phycisphaerae bacterium]HRR86183.1 hypothetical protein [Phycisphaerae bacterium]
MLTVCRKLLHLCKGDTPYYSKCGYNLTDLTSPRCPECGGLPSEVPVVRGELAIGRSLRIWLVVGMLLMLVIGVAAAIVW